MTKDATYEKNDFLVIGPNCWGRAKTQELALSAATRSFPHGKKELVTAKFSSFQIADQVDRIEVDGVDGFVMMFNTNGEQMSPKLFCKKLA